MIDRLEHREQMDASSLMSVGLKEAANHVLFNLLHAKGDKGDTEVQGHQGPRGYEGSKGDQGYKGDAGSQGSLDRLALQEKIVRMVLRMKREIRDQMEPMGHLVTDMHR